MLTFNKEELIEKISALIKLVRVEAGYSQDEMAEVLGISKKTLIQIEKGRILASWSIVVTLIALFQNSEIIAGLLGTESLEIIELLAHKEIYTPKARTFGGIIWWSILKKEAGYILQQNIISKHFRIIDRDNYRWYSGFDEEEALKYFKKLIAGAKK